MPSTASRLSPDYLSFHSLAPANAEPALPPLSSFEPSPSTLEVLLNGETTTVPCRLPDSGGISELQSGLELARHSGGFVARTRNRRAASATMVFGGLADPPRKRSLVNELRAELLQRAMDELAESDLPRGCIPSWTATTRADDQVIVSLQAAGRQGRRLVEKLAFSLRTPLMRLIQPGANPVLILGSTLHREVVVECRATIVDEHGVPLAANDNAGPPQAARTALEALGLAGRAHPTLAAADNRRVLNASLAVAEALGWKRSTLTEKWLAHAGRWGSDEPLVHWWQRGDSLNVTLSAPDPTETMPAVCESRAPLVVGAVAVAASLGHAARVLERQGLELRSFDARWTEAGNEGATTRLVRADHQRLLAS
jgi:hypothetical protein